MSNIPYSPTSGVVVTGAASGIGRACALALAEAGMTADDIDEITNAVDKALTKVFS